MKPLDPRLLRHSRSSRGFLFLLTAIAATNTLATITIALALSRLITNLFQRHLPFQEQKSLTVTLIVLFSIKAFTLLLNQKVATKYSNRIRSELRNLVLHRIFEGRVDLIYERGSASTALLLTRGISDLDGYFTKFLPQLFIAATLPLIVGVTILRFDFNSALIIACTIPLIPLFGYMIGRFTGEATERKLKTLHQLGGYFLDLLEGVTTLKMYGRSKKQSANIEMVGDRYREETLGVLRISFLSSLALELVATLSVALIAVSIGLRLVHGGLPLRTGLLVLILAPEVYWPLRQVAMRFHDVEDGVQISDQIFGILDAPQRQSGFAPTRIDSISWSDITVQYPNRDRVEIPAGILTQGGLHSLVGPSGSGKSTLFALILGFLTPTTGEIFATTEAGLKPYSELDLEALRARISWLPQEPHLASGRIIESMGAADADTARELLSRVALAESEITGGVEAHVGSANDFLSYGQKRKLALLRAINKDADILLVDEPTASVDELSESAIRETLEKVRASGKTIFLSSHRPGLIQGADSELALRSRR